MNRKALFNIHFYLSSFFTPFLLLMAITGASYLLDQKGSSSSNLVKEKIVLDKENAKDQIRAILKEVDKNYRFEGIKDRGTSIETRPTTRNYYNFNKESDGTFSLYKIEPSFLLRLIEVHKGHGPALLRYLQITLGICLILIVITGLLMSLQMKNRVKEFAISATVGFTILAVFFLI